MNCQDIEQFMHEYLDEEISEEHEQQLMHHLKQCTLCQKQYQELEKTIALVKGMSHITAPEQFTMNIMHKLPKEKKKIGIQRWLRHHPMLTAASLFLILMMGSAMTSWNKEQDLSVTKQPNLIIENNTVIVPEGEVVQGDVVVRNGTLRIDGMVDGDVTIINGDKYLASAGNVTGDIKEINALFEWLWYHIKNTANEIVHLFDHNEDGEKQSQGVAVFPAMS